ncbi:hypothetical protein V5O48_018174 [Marasmius crinis-equi]|uniref:Uncharacterized protein n=1 Tax=Marasmius crinis-equi TaxID=585013 RepID=A0ABR3ELX7_9AGAR
MDFSSKTNTEKTKLISSTPTLSPRPASGGDTETASLPVSSIPHMPTRRMKRPFELTVPPATPRTPRRFNNGSEDEDREIPPMSSTPIKGDLAIAVRKEEREEEERERER